MKWIFLGILNHFTFVKDKSRVNPLVIFFIIYVMICTYIIIIIISFYNIKTLQLYYTQFLHIFFLTKNQKTNTSYSQNNNYIFFNAQKKEEI